MSDPIRYKACICAAICRKPMTKIEQTAECNFSGCDVRAIQGVLGDRQLMVQALLFICNVQNEPRYWHVQGRPNSEFGQIRGRRIGRGVDNRNPWENGVHKTQGRALLILRYFLAPQYKVKSRFQNFFFVSPILLTPTITLTLYLDVVRYEPYGTL